MTAKKRFHYYPKSQMIIDVFTGKRSFGHDAICKLLNILYEENEQLKSVNQELSNIISAIEKGSCRSIDSFLDDYCTEEILKEFDLE